MCSGSLFQKLAQQGEGAMQTDRNLFPFLLISGRIQAAQQGFTLSNRTAKCTLDLAKIHQGPQEARGGSSCTYKPRCYSRGF